MDERRLYGWTWVKSGALGRLRAAAWAILGPAERIEKAAQGLDVYPAVRVGSAILPDRKTTKGW
jgi:hypothetical protein